MYGLFDGTPLLINNQGINHNKPNEAIIGNVARQPKVVNKNAMSGAEIIAPIEAPALNIPCANARSFVGNHSAFDFAAPGQLPASPNPRKHLKVANEKRPPEMLCNPEEMLQIQIEKTKPNLVPIIS